MAITVCCGVGWDSVAMLIKMSHEGIRPDLITFADVGAEKPGTYAFIPLLQQWLADHSFPELTICEYKPMDKTHDRYREAAQAAADRCGIKLDEVRLNRLARIYGNMVANETLPGLAFGMKSCSIKWKVEAQEPPRLMAQPLIDAWHRGEKVTKLIGFDATEDHRAGTFGDGKGLDIGNVPGLPKYRDRYVVEYWLRKWGINREGCGKLIVGEGLPLPPKSACFFCPAMRPIEIAQLQQSDPELYALAIEMERLFREGRHFRGDNLWTVKAKHKVTGEEGAHEVIADTATQARTLVRALLDDDASPYQWKLTASATVPGLGRNFAWSHLQTPA